MKDFVNIPGYPQYLVDRKGTVYDTELKRFIKVTSRKEFYPYVHLRNSLRKPVRVWMHRIIALAFIPNNDPLRIMVNHIDGNKQNYSVENLEWVTCAENTRHAFAVGLRTNTRWTATAVLVRDFDTLAVTEYANCAEAGKALGLHKGTVHARAASDGQRTWPDNKQYKLKSSDTEWAKPDLAYGEGKKRRIQAKSLISGLIKEFDSQREAARFFGLSEAKISVIMEHDNPVLPDKWQLRYATLEEWKKVPDYYELLEKTINGKCCAIWNDSNTFIYETCMEGAKSVGISPTAFNYRLSTRGLKLIKGYYYGYYSDYKGRL